MVCDDVSCYAGCVRRRQWHRMVVGPAPEAEHPEETPVDCAGVCVEGAAVEEGDSVDEGGEKELTQEPVQAEDNRCRSSPSLSMDGVVAAAENGGEKTQELKEELKEVEENCVEEKGAVMTTCSSCIIM